MRVIQFKWDPQDRTKPVRGRRVNIPGEKTYLPRLSRDNFWLVGNLGTDSDDTRAVWWVRMAKHGRKASSTGSMPVWCG